jgi:predicted ester cyclase
MAEVLWEGTHTGLLKGPFGEIPATGKRGSVNAVQIFHFEGDKIRELRHYFDLMTVLNQIGVPALAKA